MHDSAQTYVIGDVYWDVLSDSGRISDLNSIYNIKMRFPIYIIIVNALFNRITSVDVKFEFLIDVIAKNVLTTGRRIGSAPDIAISDIKKQGLLAGHNIKYSVTDVGCRTDGLREVVKSWNGPGSVQAFIGSSCSDMCHTTALVGAAFGIPHVSYGCTSVELMNRELYRTFARVVGPVEHEISELFVQMAKQFGWKKVAILFRMNWLTSAASVIRTALNTAGVHVDYFIRIGLDANEQDAYNVIATLRNEPDPLVVLMIMRPPATFYLLKAASEMQLNTGRHLFIALGRLLEYFTTDAQRAADENNLLIVHYMKPETVEYYLFEQRVVNAFPTATLQVDDYITDRSEVDIEAGLLYDATFLVARAVDRTLKDRILSSGGKFGERVTEYMLQDDFMGITGRIKLNRFGARSINSAVCVMKNGKECIRLMTYRPRDNKMNILTSFYTIEWPAGVGIRYMPAYNPPSGLSTALIGLISVVAVFLFLGFMVCLFVTVVRRKIKHESESSTQKTWELKWSLIQMSTYTNIMSDENLNASVSRVAGMSSLLQSEPAAIRQHQMSVIGRPRRRFSVDLTAVDSATGIMVPGLKGSIAFLQDRKIVLRSIEKSFHQNFASYYAEFALLRRLHHENLNEFIGACIDNTPHIYICMSYCSNGSVWDLMDNNNLNLSWDFRLSLIMDIALGMGYLHSSRVSSHGHLTSKNCVVDSRWTCKVTDYGAANWRQRYVGMDDEEAETLLWTAPELLRLPVPQRPAAGTKDGDVYSYGIIVQEVCFHDKPFGSLLAQLGAQYIIEQVVATSSDMHVFRPTDIPLPPEMPDDPHSFSPHWITLMELCWQENPSSRPTFHDVLKIIKQISGGRSINAVEDMINILESHAQKLQELVMQNDQQVFEQKERGETLLYNILPREVVAQLRGGLKVSPESFDAVTISMSDIVSFTPLAAAMTPIQVIGFLSELYNMFDEVIDKYGIHKVETIGDAYLVVSGLERTGIKHVSAIAKFALEIIECVMYFKIPSFPDKKVQLRVGLHTGPVLAGVVGVKMPRYCLFGDAVLIANMVSQSANPNRICMTETTTDIMAQHFGTDFLFSLHDGVYVRNMKTYYLLSKNDLL